MRPKRSGLLICVALLHCFGSAVMAQQSKAIWGLFPGDSFSVSSVVVRSTELQQGTAAAVTLETRDRCFLEYRVRQVGADGDVLMDVRLQSPSRELRTSPEQPWRTAAASQRKLESIAVQFIVDPRGNITQFAPQDREQLIAILSGNDSKFAALLSASLPEEVMAGWFGKVFSVPQHRSLEAGRASGGSKEEPSPESAKTTWSQTWVDSVGPFGVIRSSLEFQSKAASDDGSDDAAPAPDDESDKPESPDSKESPGKDLMECLITGEARYVPLVVPESIQPSGLEALPFESLEIRTTNISGKARLSKKAFFDSKSSRRPPAETLEWSWTTEGGAVLRDNPQRKADEQNVTFRHSETHTIVLSGYSYHGDELIIAPPPDAQ
ncbi:MAG: hypothetical protein U0996_14070 [Planctomycetaceae bacterium]